MNTPNNALTTANPAPQQSFSMANIMSNPDVMDRMERMANMMASAKINVPAHFRGSPGDCFAVVMQATTWGMNPFVVAQKTFSINGTLGYEAQLVSAVINASGAVKDRFHFEWFGPWEKIIGKFKEVESRTKKDDNGHAKKYIVPAWEQKDEHGLGIRVWATLKGEDEPRTLELLLTQARTRNSTLWTEDPKLQIAYLAQKRWTNLYAPDVILGVYTPDEIVEQPEKFMGAAEVVQQADVKEKGIPQDLRHAALEASKGGVKSFQAWFRTISPDQRSLLGPMRPECEEIWVKADQERTIDNTPPAQTNAAKQNPPADIPAVTINTVIDRMNAARNMDALDVAFDWANELTDKGELAQAQQLYDTRKAQFGNT